MEQIKLLMIFIIIATPFICILTLFFGRYNMDYMLILSELYNLVLSKDIDNEKVLLTVMYNRLQRWQKMFRKVRNKLLTEQEQQGLIGELYFLKEFLLKNYQHTIALSFWRGPLGDKQDFGIGSNSVEIKTKLGTSSSSIKISSIEQLDFQTQSAFLFVLTLSNSNENSISLNSIINEIKTIINDLESLELFESLLLV